MSSDSKITDYPRQDFPDDDMRAWLTDPEREILEGANCPDLKATVTIGVELAEHQEARKSGGKRSRKKLTPEQQERESAAGKKIRGKLVGMSSRTIHTLLAMVAQLRASTIAQGVIGAQKERAAVVEYLRKEQAGAETSARSEAAAGRTLCVQLQQTVADALARAADQIEKQEHHHER